MINFYDIKKQSIKEHNPNWSNSWSPIQNINNLRFWIGKPNSLFNLISHQPDIDKIYLCAKDLYEAKYQLLINKRDWF